MNDRVIVYLAAAIGCWFTGYLTSVMPHGTAALWWAAGVGFLTAALIRFIRSKS